MHKLVVNTRDGLLKLSLRGSPNSVELNCIFSEIEQARGQFSQGYKLWITLPDHLRDVRLGEAEKLDLVAYGGKLNGLKKVIVEASAKCNATQKVVFLLRQIYQGLNLPIYVVSCKAEALKRLGLLWRE